MKWIRLKEFEIWIFPTGCCCLTIIIDNGNDVLVFLHTTFFISYTSFDLILLYFESNISKYRQSRWEAKIFIPFIPSELYFWNKFITPYQGFIFDIKKSLYWTKEKLSSNNVINVNECVFVNSISVALAYLFLERYVWLCSYLLRKSMNNYCAKRQFMDSQYNVSEYTYI